MANSSELFVRYFLLHDLLSRRSSASGLTPREITNRLRRRGFDIQIHAVRRDLKHMQPLFDLVCIDATDGKRWKCLRPGSSRKFCRSRHLVRERDYLVEGLDFDAANIPDARVENGLALADEATLTQGGW